MSAIVVDGVGKRFRKYSEHRPQTFTEVLRHGSRHLQSASVFWALRDISFSIPQGTMLGVIGGNGAGKSTLLRLIGGVGSPDTGRLTTNGRIGAILDLGAGFHPDLTGRENLYINGVIGGLTRREVAERLDQIVAFAEAESYIDNPLRTYSTGMQMRLAFAVAVHINPDILLIDEVLAVGDLAFQNKCLDRIHQFKNRGCTIVLVSHDIDQVQALCDQVLWLRDGQVAALGEASVVVGQYRAEMQSETRRRTPSSAPPRQTPQGIELRANENRFGSLEMEITAVHLLDKTGQPTTMIESGEPLQLAIFMHSNQPLDPPHVSVTITREDGLICFDTNTAAAGVSLPQLNGNTELHLTLDRVDLVAGDFFVDVGLFPLNWVYAYDYHWHVYPLRINGPAVPQGIIRLPQHWHLVQPSGRMTGSASAE